MQKSTARPLALVLILLGGLIRITQALNFAPVGAISLFAGLWELCWALGWADPKLLPPPHIFLGNIAERSIREIWNGPVAKEIRRRYLSQEFARLPLCGACKIDEVREISVEADGRETIGDLEAAAEETV